MQWRPLLIAALAALSGAGSMAQKAPDPLPATDRARDIDVTLTPVLDATRRQFAAIDVALRFRGESDGETQLNLPDDWGGMQAAYRRLGALTITGADSRPGDTPARRILRHRPDALITVSYRIAAAPWSGARGQNAGNDYLAIVAPQFFQLIGHTFLPLPDSAENEDLVTVHLPRLPAPMRLASDLEHLSDSKPLTVDALLSSVTMGGDISVIDAGGGARLAMRGDFPARNADGWRSAFQKIWTVQRGFWRDSSDERFLVTILSYAPERNGYSVGGTGLGDSFAFFATQNADPAQIDEILMHELVHTWLPLRIGDFPDLPPEREAEAYWLSEGFTDYVKMRGMVTGGYWSSADFARQFNELSFLLTTSPLRSTPNARSAPRFWRDHDGQKLPYYRGAMFAFLLDSELRRASGGRRNLDDILRGIYRDVQQEGEQHGRGRDAVMRLADAANASGVGIDQLIRRHITEGRPITLPADLFAPCGQIVTVDRPVFELGFDLAASSGPRQAQGVIRNSAAWRAGLRNGMPLRGWSVQNGDVTRTASVDVTIDGAPRKLEWLPVAARPIRTQQLQLDPNRNDTACLARLGR